MYLLPPSSLLTLYLPLLLHSIHAIFHLSSNRPTTLLFSARRSAASSACTRAHASSKSSLSSPSSSTPSSPTVLSPASLPFRQPCGPSDSLEAYDSPFSSPSKAI